MKLDCERSLPKRDENRTNLQLKLSTASHRGMLESLDDTHVRVLHRSVLSDKDNVDGVVHSVVTEPKNRVND